MDNSLKIKKNYDRVCKKILSEKSILAWIMKYCIWEYRDISLDDIKNKYIEGEVQINDEELDSDSNYITDVISGMNTEDSTIDEGYITYDIKYKAILPVSNTTASLIINIEAQNNKNTKYSILKRAMFYASRMISAQKGMEFKNQDYDKINKVYSIWLFTTPFKKRPTTITEYKMNQHNIVGIQKEELYNYDLIDIITIYLGENDNEIKTSDSENNQGMAGFISLMKVLFTNSAKRGTIRLENTLSRQFGVDIDNRFREEIDDMCNLSEGVFERGRLKGLEEARALSDSVFEKGKLEGIEENTLAIAKNMVDNNLNV